MVSGKREDLPKELITIGNHQARERQYKSLAKNSRAKTAHAIAPMLNTTRASASSSTMAISSVEVKEKESNEAKQKQKQADAEEVGEVVLDVESISPLVIDDPVAAEAKDSAGKGGPLQSTSAVALGIDAEAPMEIEGEEQMESE